MKKIVYGISFFGVMALSYSLLVFLPAKCAEETSKIVKEVSDDWIGGFAEGCQDIFGLTPRVTEGGVMILEGDMKIAEMSVLQERFTYTYTWTHEGFLWSTKKIRIQGSFLAKAGYDLQKPFHIDISSDGRTIQTHMPEPQLNSLELQYYRVLIDEDGWFNELSSKNRQYSINRMINRAKTHILSSSLLSRTEKSFRGQIDEIVRSKIPRAEILLHNHVHH